ncbi:wall-associated receptor kinase galacturonan-binding protein isoform X2 [Tasmannia lanceolata]|uniref:wall-associated receptor kinase galacturonan-binding protein isoform X2 n=1 Tax=Tasmannia lanceolata TaxID=3420 RepID=UPI0040628913
MAFLFHKPKTPSGFSLPLLFISILHFSFPCIAQSTLCRTYCGNIPINYPFSIDDGCGSPYYRNILVCSNSTTLQLRTPSGKYPVLYISYSDPHILVSDPYMWNCKDGPRFRRTRPFSLDTSTHFSLSMKNDYLFFNCDPNAVIVKPKPSSCERFPDQCDSLCDSSSYLCRNLPECPFVLSAFRTSCCSYYPKASESLRLMLQHCASYTSVYWKTVSATPPYDQVPEYGIRVDFDIPVTTRCLQCQDNTRGGGTCGFDTQSQSFLCLCQERNVTTFCTDHIYYQHRSKAGVIAGTTIAVSVVGAIGVGAMVWYLKKVRPIKPVTTGVQSNENRLF